MDCNPTLPLCVCTWVPPCAGDNDDNKGDDDDADDDGAPLVQVKINNRFEFYDILDLNEYVHTKEEAEAAEGEEGPQPAAAANYR